MIPEGFLKDYVTLKTGEMAAENSAFSEIFQNISIFFTFNQ